MKNAREKKDDIVYKLKYKKKSLSIAFGDTGNALAHPGITKKKKKKTALPRWLGALSSPPRAAPKTSGAAE